MLLLRQTQQLAKKQLTLCNQTLSKMAAVEAASAQDAGKRAAGFRAADEHLRDGMCLGVGSGSTVVFMMERAAQLATEHGWRLRCVPTSFQARQLISQHAPLLQLCSLDEVPVLDVCIDGADEVDTNLCLIKGGGAALLQEKVVASCAGQLVIIADSGKRADFLGQRWHKGLPLEVFPMAYTPVMRRIESELGGRVEVRMATRKLGPVITDNGNMVLDWHFPAAESGARSVADWRLLDERLHAIPGLLETGLFLGMASCVYFGSPDGNVQKLVDSQ